MDVHELSRDQLIELKQRMLCDRYQQPSWFDMVDADNKVSDDEVFREYEGTEFVPDDFFCSMEED